MNLLISYLASFILLQVEPSQSILLKSEKIYSVLAVLLVIFTGVILFLVLLNRKINKLEKQVDSFDQ
ncbi:MAG: CcmD family protein [Bacteroidota bacterium]